MIYVSISVDEPALNLIVFPLPELIETPMPFESTLSLTLVPIILRLLWVAPLIKIPLPCVAEPVNFAPPPILPPAM